MQAGDLQMAKDKLFSDLGGLSRKKLEIAVIVGVLAIAALILLPSLGGMAESGKSTEATSSSVYFDAATERKQLQQTLSAIKGAGAVEVMITYQGTPEKVPALETNTQRSTTEENGSTGSRSVLNQTDSANLASEQNKTVVVSERRPDVLGVVVVAEGADDISVKVALAGAVQTALGISADKVDVYEMTRAK